MKKAWQMLSLTQGCSFTMNCMPETLCFEWNHFITVYYHFIFLNTVNSFDQKRNSLHMQFCSSCSAFILCAFNIYLWVNCLEVWCESIFLGLKSCTRNKMKLINSFQSVSICKRSELMISQFSQLCKALQKKVRP